METTSLARERVQNTLVARTFMWLSVGLVSSGAVAAWVGLDDQRYQQFVDNRALYWIVLLAPIAIIMALGWGMNRLSVVSASLLYLLFSFAEGLTLSFIFQAYTTSSVAQVFFISAAMFGIAGTVGFVTKRDLSKLGGILFVALLGLILGTVVNLFWASDTLYWVTTYAGIAI